jgi:hypothetical protein
MLKRTFVALSIAALAWSALASAQESATLILRSGERVSGQLVDMGGAGFTLKVSGQDRQIATNDVAAIDFTGGDIGQGDWNRVSSGQHVALLRSGQAVTGQLYDIGGTTPLRITFKTDSGERDLTSNEISRIILARPNDVAAPTSGTTGATGSAEGKGITVSAQQQWTPTGITVRSGEWITLNTTGEIRVSGDPNDVAISAGVKNQRRDPAAPLPDALTGALIGRIGNSEPFAIGNQTKIRAPATGQLFLGINDSNLSDNQGSFQVQIQKTGSRR